MMAGLPKIIGGLKLYIQVITKNEEAIFNKLWEESCIEKGYEFESTSSNSELFLIYKNEDKPIGTVECVPYDKSDNNCNKVFPFHSLEIVNQNPTKIFEIDKVSLLKNERGPHLSKILEVIYTYAVYNNYSYGIALLEPVFFRALKIFYKLPLESVTEEMIFYKGDNVIPSIINFEIIKSNIQGFEWIRFNKRKTVLAKSGSLG